MAQSVRLVLLQGCFKKAGIRFKRLYEENTKPSVKCLACLNFLIDLRFFYDFYRGEGRSDRTLIEWGRDVVLVAVSCPLVLVETSVAKF